MKKNLLSIIFKLTSLTIPTFDNALNGIVILSGNMENIGRAHSMLTSLYFYYRAK
jgi:hypothetical protein